MIFIQKVAEKPRLLHIAELGNIMQFESFAKQPVPCAIFDGNPGARRTHLFRFLTPSGKATCRALPSAVPGVNPLEPLVTDTFFTPPSGIVSIEFPLPDSLNALYANGSAVQYNAPCSFVDHNFKSIAK